MIYQIAYLFFENRSHNKLEYNASTAHEERERERERERDIWEAMEARLNWSLMVNLRLAMGFGVG